jgi:hypothetical protein
MNELYNIAELVRGHEEREMARADVFARVAPAAINAQNDLFCTMMEERNEQWRDAEAMQNLLGAPATVRHGMSEERIAKIKELIGRTLRSGHVPALREISQVARAMSLQPVRDLTVDIVLVLGEDRALDLCVPRYPQEWLSIIGDVPPHNHSVWADPITGSFGFDHLADHQYAFSGAALYVRFVPRIAPSFAQIRPLVPYSFQYLCFSFADNSAGFGIRVFSWDFAGGYQVIEQDYRYSLWNERTIVTIDDPFPGRGSPNWYEGPPEPGWTYDYAFLYGNESPYFAVKPGRVYAAAIWCFGACKAWGKLDLAVGRLHAQLPWVVIGYH